jgi:hypothetical protein
MLALRNPVEMTIGLALTAAAAAIAWNALVLQTARHPAPLFGSTGAKSGSPGFEMPAPLPPTRPAGAMQQVPAAVQGPVAVTMPAAAPAAGAIPLPPRPATRDSIGDLIRTGEPTGNSVSQPTRPTPATIASPVKLPAMRDPIGDLIRLNEPAPVPPGLVGKVEPSRSVAAGQRALAALGHDVKADGLMGPSTRHAIEQFERERGLPVTGEFGSRTIRELIARSGLPVE